jgi:hypothetical protein
VRVDVGFVLVTFADTDSGFSLDDNSVPEDELAPYIQQAIDQVCTTEGVSVTPTNHISLTDKLCRW